MNKKNFEFKKYIWSFYNTHERSMPWRETRDPYAILVSELMLQQTQVARVLIKYPEFLSTFPDFTSLAKASLIDVLTTWQGMGYNRRAKYLKAIAEIVVHKYQGILPQDPVALVSFPGIGPNTAGSITAFAFNRPVIFIETNIRRVMIHHFFQDKEGINDKEIMPFIEQTIDSENPREWYYALMDYGAYLSKIIENPNKKSKHYVVQSKFEGSTRQIRSNVIKKLLESPHTIKELKNEITDERFDKVLNDLLKEGFINEEKGTYTIK